MNYTTHYNLAVPDPSDAVSSEDFNAVFAENPAKIDAALHTIAQTLQNIPSGGGSEPADLSGLSLSYSGSTLSLRNGNDTLSSVSVSVSGGGGTSAGTACTIDLANGQSQSRSIADGAQCPVTVTWSSTRTGTGTVQIAVDSGDGSGYLTKFTQGNVPQGDFSVDVSPFLRAGAANLVRFTVTDSHDNSDRLTLTVNSVSVSLESNFRAAQIFTKGQDISFACTPKGSNGIDNQKTLHVLLDETTEFTKSTAASGSREDVEIPTDSLSHGTHSIRAWFTIRLDADTTIQSNTLHHVFICADPENLSPVIATGYEAANIAQYESIRLEYFVYTPGSDTSDITISVNGSAVQTAAVDRSMQSYTYRATSAGSLSLSITSGSANRAWTIQVSAASASVAAVTNRLALHLDPAGRSNQEAENHRTVWVSTTPYGGTVTARLENFNFSSDGWMEDSDGAFLHVSGRAVLTIPYQLFGQDFKTDGKTIEIEFAARNVADYNADIIHCLDSAGRGLKITPQSASLISAQSTISVPYKEEEHFRLAFVVEPADENDSRPLIHTYLDGMASGVQKYVNTDSAVFRQSDPRNITVGSPYCDVDIYAVRVYDSALNRNQIRGNWTADAQNADTLRRRLERNAIFDGTGAVSAALLPADLPYMTIVCRALPQQKGDKKTCRVIFTDPSDASRGFSAVAEIDVQGTSSAGYARKNYKIKFKNGFTMTVSGDTVQKYPLRKTDAVATSAFCLKADVASSEGANNVELVRLYEILARKLGVLSPPQSSDSAVRQGIDGFPIVLFWQEIAEDTIGDSNTYVGSSVFLGKYNFNNDKGTPEVFGFSGDNAESWEIKSNTSPLTAFLSNTFNANWNSADYEARYPEEYDDNTNLKAMTDWVYSTRDNPAAFRQGFENWFDLGSATLYYLFTLFFLMVDSRQKNMFPTRWKSTGKWMFYPYDFDTALGINNSGQLIFSPSLEDTDKDGTDDVFNGQNSVLWVNFRAAFWPEIKAMYVRLRGFPEFSYAFVESMFEDHQGKWPEAVFNEDAYFKYLQPYIENGTDELDMLLGSKRLQRMGWLSRRFRYMDSLFHTGDASGMFLQFRPYYTIPEEERAAGAVDLHITPAVDMYVTAAFDGDVTSPLRARAGQEVTVENPVAAANDGIYRIYSIDQILSLGDLSPLRVGNLQNLNRATRLQSLKLGDGGNYENSALSNLDLGTNTMLRSLDVRNCSGLTNPINLQNCPNIREIRCEGTHITGVYLPDGGVVETLHLPATVTELTIKNHPYLSDLTMTGAQNLLTLNLDNCGSAALARTKSIVAAMPSGAHIFLQGFLWEVDDEPDAERLLRKLQSMSGVYHEDVNDDVSGTIRVGTMAAAKIAAWSAALPSVTVTANAERTYTVTFHNDYDPNFQPVSVSGIAYGASAAYPYNTDTLTMDVQFSSGNEYQFDGWSVNLSSITSDMDCYAEFSFPALITDSWNEIIRKCNSASAEYRGAYQVGNTAELNLSDGTTLLMQIAAMDTDSLSAVNGTAHITWIAQSLLPVPRRINTQTIWSALPVAENALAEAKRNAAIASGLDPDDPQYSDWMDANYYPHVTEQYGKKNGQKTYEESVAFAQASGDMIYFTIHLGAGDYKKKTSNLSKFTFLKASGERSSILSSTVNLKLTENDDSTVTAALKITTLALNGSDWNFVFTGSANEIWIPVDIKKIPKSGGSVGGWETCELRGWLSEEFLPQITDTGLPDGILSVSKTHPSRTDKGTEATQTTMDKVWIPSSAEIASGGYSVFSSDDTRLRTISNSETVSSWWTRSASSGTFYSVGVNGVIGSSTQTDQSIGILIGFCT